MEQAIKDKAPKPAGLVPKNLQAFLLVGLAMLMVLVMALTGHKRPVPPNNAETASTVPNIVPVNADKVNDFQKGIEQTQRESAPQAEEALLQKQRQLAAQGMGSAQPFPSTPYGTPVTSAYPNGAYPPGAYAAAPSQPGEGQTDPVKDEQKKRTYLSLFSDNIALTYRKELRQITGRATSALAAPDQLASQANAELAHGEEILAEAQKAGLAPQTTTANNPLPNAASTQKCGRPHWAEKR